MAGSGFPIGPGTGSRGPACGDESNRRSILRPSAPSPSLSRDPLSTPDSLPPPSNQGQPVIHPGPGGSAGPLPEPASLWGARLESLVCRAGETLEGVPWEAIDREAGSWVDPMFSGPGALGNLPGLGDRYRDLTQLGEGATARVFRAMDTLLQRPVALKVLKNEAGSTLAEARAQAQVEHPNVCRIYEVGRGYLIMQLVEGPTLAGLAPGLDLRERVRILRDIALGIHAAHCRGLVHLDLKLGNVLMQRAEDGTLAPIVTDFGMVLGGASRAGACPMGTPPFTSPEQLAGDPAKLDRRADVYALGVMLYVLAARAIPFQAENLHDLLEAMAHAAPVPLRQRDPGLPVDLARIVHRCLEKDPGARYPTAKELADDLERYLTLYPVQAMGAARFYRLGKWAQRNRKAAWVGTLGLIAILAMAGFMIRNDRFNAEQANWDNHFQKQVEDLRSGLDHLYRQPAHDIGPERRQLAGRIQALRDEVARGGAPAQGPGHLALGQALRLLDPQDPEAVYQFQAAWDQGLRTEAARAWLVVARVHDFYQAAFRRGQNPEPFLKRLALARERYLKPARNLLEGRGGSDQARLAHLTEMTEALLQEPLDEDRMIQLARTFRARFPDDLDAMLEEAGALEAKADTLSQHLARDSRSWPPQGTTEVEGLRDASRRLRLEAHRLAPSNPMIYADLAQGCRSELLHPTSLTANAETVLDQERSWLEQGLRVAPEEPRLAGQYFTLLTNEALRVRLQQGRGPGPLPEELLKVLERALDRADGSILTQALAGVQGYLATCGSYGFLANIQAANVYRQLDRAPVRRGNGAAYRSALWNWCLEASRYRVEAGLEPWSVPLQEKTPATAVGGAPEWVLPFRSALNQARYLLDRGDDPSGPLGEAAGLLPTGDRSETNTLSLLEIQMLLLRASWDGRDASWKALEAALAKGERPLTEANFLRPQIEAKLALARSGHDPDGALLREVRRLLESGAVRRQWPGSAVHQKMAELCLLEARRERTPDRSLQEGLREASAALVYPVPWGAGDARYLPEPRQAFPPQKGRACLLQGEIYLALAEAERGRGTGVQKAHQALASFRRALTFNPNLEGSLAPLRARAQSFPDPPPMLKPDRSVHRP